MFRKLIAKVGNAAPKEYSVIREGAGSAVEAARHIPATIMLPPYVLSSHTRHSLLYVQTTAAIRCQYGAVLTCAVVDCLTPNAGMLSLACHRLEVCLPLFFRRCQSELCRYYSQKKAPCGAHSLIAVQYRWQLAQHHLLCLQRDFVVHAILTSQPAYPLFLSMCSTSHPDADRRRCGRHPESMLYGKDSAGPCHFSSSGWRDHRSN